MQVTAATTRRANRTVAGLDLLTDRERDADNHAHHIAAALTARGLTAPTIATHWAQVGQLRHVALSIEAAGDPDILWDTLSDIAAAGPTAGGVTGQLLSGRYRGEPALRDTLASAVTAHHTRGSGRAVVYPGWSTLTGTLTVGQILARSTIDEIRVLAGAHFSPATPVMTRDFVRPRWTEGRLVLDAQPAAHGMLAPFETPTPTACCADHR